MDLLLSDTFIDEAGTWEIVGPPSTQCGGKEVKVKVQRVDDPRTIRDHWWPAYSWVTVIRKQGSR
jgi:hypothetical protein